MTPFAFFSALLLLVAVLGILNERYVKLPHTIGLLAGSLLLSVAVLLVDRAVDAVDLRAAWRAFVDEMDLPHLFLDGMLALMLFAGTLHVNLRALRTEKYTVAALATVSVVLATFLYGFGIYFVLAMKVPLIWCLTLGALLAPTDPVAVSGLLRKAGLPADQMALVNGESLFNDGVAVVMFSLMLNLASGHSADALSIMGLFAWETVGGITLGTVAGWAAYQALRLVDHPTIELTITLAAACMTYTLAHSLHMSGPLAVVVTGLIIAHKGTRRAMRPPSRTLVIGFWEVVDELLNALLFVLLGFSLLSLEPGQGLIWAAIGGVVLALATRLVSVAIPTFLIHFRGLPPFRTVAILTWGGLRGGMSIALALTLHDSPYRPNLLAQCYAVVVFTIIVQGLTMPYLVRWLYPASRTAEPEPVDPALH
ncbi:MAG: sodium:proton antiporter [Proteobacteria bacterium]|nr:sodium:proton antiporter [Pseudomonadota bacterium]